MTTRHRRFLPILIVLTLHPSGNRMLTISYRYPAGEDSAQRVEQLIDVLSYLE